MAKDAGWGRRLRTARRAFVERHDRTLPYKEIGALVGAALRREPFTHTTVRAWFTEGQEPDSFALAAALADVLEADPGWLAFGRYPTSLPSPQAVAEFINGQLEDAGKKPARQPTEPNGAARTSGVKRGSGRRR